MYICLRMRKVIYISTIVLTFGFVSCDKQEYNPIYETNQDAPVWDKGNSPFTVGDDVIDDGDVIVDPNYDPDGKSRRN